MNSGRIESVKKAMEREKLDLLICRLPENVLFLTGYQPIMGWTYLYFPLDGDPSCIVPHCFADNIRESPWGNNFKTFQFATLDSEPPYAYVRKFLKDKSKGKKIKKIGFENNFDVIAPPWNTAEIAIPSEINRSLISSVFDEENMTDISDLMNGLRKCKNSCEIEKLRIAGEISAFGLEAFRSSVREGMSGVEIVCEVEKAIMLKGTGYKGARQVRGFAQVYVGEETSKGADPVFVSTTRKLGKNDISLLELGVVADGYWADRTRVRCAGKPTTRQLEIFGVAQKAQKAAVDKVKAGVTAGEVDEAARSIIRDAGFADGFNHVTGHGLGFRYHEPVPLIAPGSGLILEKGMVHTVEPGIYFRGDGGFRVEDNVVVTETGSEIFGTYDTSLTD